MNIKEKLDRYEELLSMRHNNTATLKQELELIDLADWLIEHGADINFPEEYRETTNSDRLSSLLSKVDDLLKALKDKKNVS